jgi:hypothetical protein
MRRGRFRNHKRTCSTSGWRTRHLINSFGAVIRWITIVGEQSTTAAQFGALAALAIL